KGFTPGEDAIQFGNRNTAADSIDSIDAFLNKLNTDFKVMLDFERKQGASSSSTSLADYNVTAIKLQFAEAMLLPGGKLAGSIVVIEFKAPIAWTEFKRDWLDGDNQANFAAIFDIDTLSFKHTDAGKAALSDLLWAQFQGRYHDPQCCDWR
ncbi:MAG: hypothetical protein ISQ21_09840, partial [Alphaproteobacteria bacterium]|nr:hypothetical protein [Alphaproteobacteria bacterium]